MRKSKDQTIEDRTSAGLVDTHTTEIDGLTYTTTTLPATKALQLLPQLVLLFGQDGLAMVLAAGVDQVKQLLATQPEMAAALFARAAAAADSEDGHGLDQTAKLILQATRCEQVQIGDNYVPAPVGAVYFDSHFKRRYRHLFDVCYWVCTQSFVEP